MKREQDERTFEPQELGIASVETQGSSWPVQEPRGFIIGLGISDD